MIRDRPTYRRREARKAWNEKRECEKRLRYNADVIVVELAKKGVDLLRMRELVSFAPSTCTL